MAGAAGGVPGLVVRRAIGGAKRERRVPSSTSCGNSPNFSSAARAAAFFAAKSSRVVPE
jgi:hypothetical protein